jgi:hypothetical protein
MEVFEMQTLRATILAHVAFSGDLDPDVDAATKTLEQAGYQVFRVPKEYRARFDDERDDFIEARITRTEDDIEAVMAEVESIVSRYGGGCHECGLVEPDEPPFVNGPH